MHSASMTESVIDPPHVSTNAYIYMSSDMAEESRGKRQKARVKAAGGNRDKNL